MKEGKVVLITGGVRSGKSRFAQQLALKWPPPVIYVATASAEDEEMEIRIRKHQQSRPKEWRTVEERSDLIGVFGSLKEVSTVIVDCLTLWISNLIFQGLNDEEILARAQGLKESLSVSDHRVILITNEVGWGIVPASKLGRRFRDLQGMVNQIMAEGADEVYLMISGLPLRIKP